MKNLRQVFLGFLIALISIGLVLGAFSLSFVEASISSTQAPGQLPTSLPSTTPMPLSTSANPFTTSPTVILILSPTITLTASPTPTLTPSAIATSTSTPGLSQTPTSCQHPWNWVPYTIRTGDTLARLATRYRTSVSDLQQANCLLPTDALIPGTTIYVPPPPTQTSLSCGRPSGWVVYIIRPNDNLYRLSLAYGVSIADLQRANCMGSSEFLLAGQVFYVPPWAPLLPSPTIPYLFTPYATWTNTPETGWPSDTPIPPTETPLPVDTPITTDIPLPTDTPIPTDTPLPTEPPAPTETSTTP